MMERINTAHGSLEVMGSRIDQESTLQQASVREFREADESMPRGHCEDDPVPLQKRTWTCKLWIRKFRS